MEKLQASDINIIIHAGVQMAQQDAALKPEEVELLQEMIRVSGVDAYNAGDFEKPLQEDIHILAQGLTSKNAKREFLLAMATVAMVDGALHEKEKELFDGLVKDLNVGTINLKELTFAKGKQMMLKILSEHKETQSKGEVGPMFDMDQIK